MNIILFLSFYCTVYVLGRGALLFILPRNQNKKIDTEAYAGVKYNTFYPIITLFIFGNLLFLINFFLPLMKALYIILFVGIIFLIRNFNEKLLIINYKDFFIKHIFIPSVLSISTYGSRLHFDSGAYHLNYQNWLREEKINIGLANLNFGYGFSSILEYLQAILWFDQNYLYIYFVNLIFYCLLFSFFYDSILYSKGFLQTSSFVLVIYGLLDNFGYLGGSNGFFRFQTIAKPDMPFAITFILLSQIIIYKIISNEFTLSDLKLISIFSIFLFQIKLLGLYIGILLLFYLYKFMKVKNINFTSILKLIRPSLLLGFFWLFKNFLLSGCLLFPLKQSCFKGVNWYVDGYISKYIYATKITQKAYFFGENINDWFLTFISKGDNKQILINFFISIILLIILKYVLFRNYRNKFFHAFVLFTSFIYIFTWIISSPSPRWGAHIFPFLIISVFVNSSLSEKVVKHRIFKPATILIILFTTAMMPRGYSYEIASNNFQTTTVVNIPEIKYISNISNNGYIVDYENFEPLQCWVNKMCLLSNKSIKSEEFLNYTIFLPDGTKKW